MILEISNDGVTKLKNGIHHFVLSDYHNIQEWEWNNILGNGVGRSCFYQLKNGIIY